MLFSGPVPLRHRCGAGVTPRCVPLMGRLLQAFLMCYHQHYALRVCELPGQRWLPTPTCHVSNVLVSGGHIVGPAVIWHKQNQNSLVPNRS
jgi:hypothetical protein